MTRQGRRTAWVLALITLAAFATALHNGFTNWDDPDYITGNRLVWGLSPDRVVTAFTSFYFTNYNPLHLVSYMVDYSLWGLDARGYLLVNLLLHFGAGLLVWRIVLRLCDRPGVAFFTTVVFLVHPTRCESVVWLSERKDVLAAVFAMAAVWFFLRGTTGERLAPRYWLATFGCFLLALLSKSQVVTLPLVLWALAVYLRRPWRRALLEQVPLLVLSAIFAGLTLRAHAGGVDAGSGLAPVEGLGVLRPVVVVPTYLLHTFWPVGLSPVYVLTEPALQEVDRWLPGAILLVVILLGALRSLRRRRVFFAGVGWFLAFLLPVLGVVPSQVLLADRYLYLAIIAPAWVLGDLLARSLTTRALAVPQAAIAIVLALLTAGYATVWRDSESFWLRVLAHAPDSSLARANLGMAYLGRGRIDEATRLFEGDLARRPYFMASFLGLAEIRRRDGRVDDALALHRRLLDLRPDSVRARLRYLALLSDVGDSERVLEEVERLRPPPCFELHQLLLRVHLDRGDLARARHHGQLSVQEHPFHEEGWYHLGLVEERLGNLALAVGHYRKAVVCNERFQAAPESLAALLIRLDRIDEAIGALDGAPRTTPSSWNLRALCRLRRGRLQGALDAIREAVGLEPDSAEYWANYARIALHADRWREAADSIRVAVLKSPGLADRLEPKLAKLLDAGGGSQGSASDLPISGHDAD